MTEKADFTEYIITKIIYIMLVVILMHIMFPLATGFFGTVPSSFSLTEPLIVILILFSFFIIFKMMISL